MPVSIIAIPNRRDPSLEAERPSGGGSLSIQAILAAFCSQVRVSGSNSPFPFDPKPNDPRQAGKQAQADEDEYGLCMTIGPGPIKQTDDRSSQGEGGQPDIPKVG